MSRYREIDLSNIKVSSVKDRHSKVDSAAFARIDVEAGLWESMPGILKAAELKEFIQRTKTAVANKKPIIIGLGGHVIKCGLAPLLIELMESGAVSCVCVNGSVTIHDYEIAFWGKTSEDVAAGLADGSFGMVFETTHGINSAITHGSKAGLGYGEVLGKTIMEKAPNAHLSLLGSAYRLGIPVTVHIAIGADIVHQTPCADGKAIGDCSLRDFRIFCEEVSKLDGGGVFINFGSAVIIPEVFLKALTVARNIHGKVQDFTTAVFDMNMHYRAMENVVKRPVLNGGKGYYFIGHHEIMIPLVLRELM
ncbi:MAG: hypothetical protein Q8J62_07055 [Candidatus Cloacimonadaceae bacterium]|nr:hypothetical protein [Candidatus Cloacimonadaceae bacterium]